MTLKEKLESDVKDAMRARDENRKSVLRMALSAIKLAEVEKGAALDDAAVMAVIQKEIKSAREAAADAERARRPELTAQRQADIAMLESYLPQALTPAGLDEIARQAIAEAGATSPREMGAVMKLLVPRLQGRASGDAASQAVRRLLGG
jgi:hypothetical protein